MAFTQKLLEFDISLANGNFQGGGNSATITGKRASCKIVKAGGASMGEASISIYGLTLSTMSQLSTFGRIFTTTEKNTVTVKAGEAGGPMTTVFVGTINEAYMDAAAMPDVAFRIEAQAGSLEQVKPVPVTSMPGKVAVQDLAKAMADKMGLQLEATGIDGFLMNPYYPGAGRQQALALAKHAGVEMFVDCGKLAFWKAGQPRQGDTTTISPSTGLVGYPAFFSAGIVVRTLFQPTLNFGTKFTVESSLQAACGEWVVLRLEYELDSLVPKGKWFQIAQGTPPNDGVVS